MGGEPSSSWWVTKKRLRIDQKGRLFHHVTKSHVCTQNKKCKICVPLDVQSIHEQDLATVMRCILLIDRDYMQPVTNVPQKWHQIGNFPVEEQINKKKL